LSCCSKKNIFYQIAPWKSDLAKNLAKDMPNTYLKKVSTSCGSIRAISYKSNYNKFVKKWDFRNRARGKLDAIVLSILAIKKSPMISELSNIVTTTKTVTVLKKKLRGTSKKNVHKRSKRKKSSKRSRRRRSVVRCVRSSAKNI
jgi:hypothetical protein